MKRPCSALTLLLASLAGSFLAIDSAKSQTGLEPYGAWHETCPSAEGASPRICHGEDGRWQDHQTHESDDYNYRSDYDAGYDEEVYGPSAEPAIQDEMPVQTESNVSEELDPYWTQDNRETLDVDAAVPQENGVFDELDPYWTQNESVPSEELDPYWTQDEVVTPHEVQEDVNVVADPVTPMEDDNSWAQTHVYGNESTEESFFENESTTESNVIDPQWAIDAANSVESWIERLTTPAEAVEESQEVNLPQEETRQGELASEEASQENLTQENVTQENVTSPQDNADSTYGAHLWDDCEIGSNHWECERPTPIVSNENDEAEMSHDQAALETRAWLLLMAHSLNEAGQALQSASQGIASFASEGVSTDSSAADGIDEYRD